MAKTINLGKVGLTFEGDYDSSKSYASRTCVFYNHVSWTSKKDVPAGIAPGTNDEYWQKVSERGEQGPQGERGPQGNSAFDGTGVEIVNDLTSGGEAAVLSAEQGKILKTELTELESEFKTLHVRSTTNTNYNLLPISCKKGDLLKVTVEIANYQGTRIFITYNGENTKRLIDSASNTDFINGEVEVVCPADISVLGVFCGTSVTYTLKVTQYGYVYDNINKLNQKASETDTKIVELSSETDTKIAELSSETELGGQNLIQNKKNWVGGYVQSGSGTPALQFGTDPNRNMVIVPVKEGEVYYYYFKGNRADLNTFLDASKERIASNFAVKDGLNKLEVPQGAFYMALTIQSGETDSYNGKWLLKEDSIAGNLQSQILQASGTSEDLKPLKLTISGSYLLFESDDFGLTTTFRKTDDFYGGNRIFNFVNARKISTNDSIAITDDVAPCHVLNTTIGANHGQPCVIATIESHGLTNKDIGTAWQHSDGTTYYIVRIVDESRVQILSSNRGTDTTPIFVNATNGTLTRSGKSLTITNVATSQLYPSAQNMSHKVVVDGVEVPINKNAVFMANEVDVIETYDVADPVSVLNNLIAKVGNSENPSYEGEPILTYQNIYRFKKGCNVIVIANIIARKEIEFRDFHFAQSALGQSFKYYIPNSLPIEGYDFRKPVKVSWNNSIPRLYTKEEFMADIANPINRIVTYGDNFGFALGYMPCGGVGKDLLKYTTKTFEIRNNTGKIYPHGVDSKVGNMLVPNQMYSGIMLRSFIDYNTKNGERMSYYSVNMNGDVYLYVDYSGSMTDNITLDEAYNGRSIEVIEGRNAELLTDVYNGGLYIKADYKENDTCFIVLKIKTK